MITIIHMYTKLIKIYKRFNCFFVFSIFLLNSYKYKVYNKCIQLTSERERIQSPWYIYMFKVNQQWREVIDKQLLIKF